MYARNDSVLICAAVKSTYTSLLNAGNFLKREIYKKLQKNLQKSRKNIFTILNKLALVQDKNHHKYYQKE